MQGLNTEFVNEKYNPEVLFSDFLPSPPSAAIKLCCKVWYEVELMQLNYNLGALFVNKLIIRLFDYSVFAASERTDPARADAKILFNFEWPKLDGGGLIVSPR